MHNAIKVRRLDKRAVRPEYATAGASGMDLRARLDADVTIRSGERALIPTGLALEIPPGCEGQVRPRSGLALKHGITVLNAPGTIDSDYRGPVSVLLINLGSGDFIVRDGDRIAQVIFAQVTRCGLQETEALSETERGSGGYGSTGI
jgi:dUTP pyrophosphatase